MSGVQAIDQELLTRSVQGMGPLPPLASLPPVDWNPQLSTLQPVEEKSQGEARTKIPLVHPGLRAAQLIRAWDKLGMKQANVTEAQIQANTQEIEAREKDRLEALRKNSEEAASQKSWKTLSNLAQVVAAGGTVALGVAAYPTSPWVAAALWWSAAAGVAASTKAPQWVASWFHQSDVLQKDLSRKIEASLFLLSTGLGLAGGIGAYTTNALPPFEVDKVKKVAQALGLAANLATSATRFGFALAEKKKFNHQADAERSTAKITELYQNSYRTARDAQNFADTEADLVQTAKEIVSATQVNLEEF